MNGRRRSRRWSLVLAAGGGTRLASLTVGADGIATPKQFCSLDGRRTLLERAIERAARLVPRERVVVVVAREHERWWRPLLADLPPENVIVQPRNRGTAAGVLLPLLAIRARDPEARVLVLPSDHYFGDERGLARTLRRGFDAVEASGSVVLFGVEPDAPDSDLGWIVPAAPAGPRLGAVETFVEKPPAEIARALLSRGAVWNTFVFLARLPDLAALYARRLPGLLDDMSRAVAAGPAEVERLYGALEPRDFSRDVLQGAESSLAVFSGPGFGWTDLGTPVRLAECVRSLRRGWRRAAPAGSFLDLAHAVLAARVPRPAAS